MLKKIRKVVWAPLMLAILLAGAFSAGGVLRGSGPALIAAEAAQSAGTVAGLPSFRGLVERLKPTVVNIRVVQKVARSSFSERMPSPGHPFQDGPFGDLFRRFRDRGPGAKRPTPEFHRRGLGSGFIYSRDGLIVTNNHVVKGADEIRVTLHGGRSFEAKVLGRDPKTDLALLKITEKVDLP
ncbi:MAG: trypsin-like peptidase domain-containing protein, partial [Nitrospinota bacterium]|nr:trypsin-like peptidase domain-containing protein [Nitrospinota bacterium]